MTLSRLTSTGPRREYRSACTFRVHYSIRGSGRDITVAVRGLFGSLSPPGSWQCSSKARTLFSGNKVKISSNKRNAFVLPEHYTEGVKIFTFTAYRNNHSSKASISMGDFWR
jgi:hypothetical protein